MDSLAAAHGPASAQLARRRARCRRCRRGSSWASDSGPRHDARPISAAWSRRGAGRVGRGGRHTADPTARGLFGMTAVTFGFPAPGAFGPSHATIGTFDGVHRGQQALLKTLVAGARSTGAASVLITFEPHPRCV